MTSTSMKSIAIAILYREDKFLVQLRDNIPTIVHPGVWALFGGHLEGEESPDDAVKREIEEEICYCLPPETRLFKSYEYPHVIRHVYVAPLNVGLEQLNLQEGWDFDLVSPETIVKGCHYSSRAGETRDFAQPHQQILLDFLASSDS